MKSNISFPISIEWNITRHCNFTCTFCSISAFPCKANSVDEGILTDKGIGAIVNNIARSGCLYVSLSGGEPLLHPNLFKIIQELRKKDIKVSISTNGSLLSIATLKRLKDLGVTWIQVSLAGATKAVNDKYMGRGAYAKVRHSLKLLEECRGIGVSVSFLQTPENETDVHVIRGMLKGTNIKVNVKKLRRVGRAIALYRANKFNTDDSELQGCPLFLAIMEDGGIKPCSEFPVVTGNALNTEISAVWPEINRLKAGYSKNKICAAEAYWDKRKS